MEQVIVQVRVFLKRLLIKHSPGFLVWAGGTLLLALIALLLTLRIFFAGAELTDRAIDSGQRISVKIASGEIEGNVRHTRREETKPPPSDTGSLTTPIISKDGLAPAPLAAIAEQSDRGLLPITGQDGTLPWKYYARPASPAARRPVVAIVFTNLALSRPLTEDVLKLGHNFTLGFSPYAGDAKNWAKKAREVGFESVVDLPMQPQNYPMADPGPYGLLDNLSPAESTARLHWVLSRFPGFVGVLAPPDEKMTNNLTAFRPTLTELTARGVLFIYLKNADNTALGDLAKAHTVLALGADRVIDADITPAAIEKQLDALADIAKTQGYAIGIAHSYPTTTDALQSWAEDLSAQGVDLVPVSAVAAKVFP